MDFVGTNYRVIGFLMFQKMTLKVMFEDWKTDSLNYLLDHEIFLYNYHPEEENKVTVLQILKTSKYTIKLIDAIKYRKEKTDVRNVKRLVRMCSEKGG